MACEKNIRSGYDQYLGVPPDDASILITFSDETTVWVTWATFLASISVVASGLLTLKVKITATGLEDPATYKADYVKAAGNTITLAETIGLRIEEITKSGTVVSDMNGDFSHNDTTGEIDFTAISGLFDNDWLVIKYKAA